jgi:site-specific recombinase XerD
LPTNTEIDESATDRRQKVVFHTLRHTCASWFVMSGVDLYTVKNIMGHSTIAMTERYAHLAPNYLKKAVSMMKASLNQSGNDNLVKLDEIAKKWQ